MLGSTRLIGTPVLRGAWVVAILLGLSAQLAVAQYKSYSAAYQQHVQSSPGVDYGTNRYLYQKYFQSNPAVSPYISGAVLGGNLYGTAYTQVIRPEMEQRAANERAQAQYIQQRKLQGNVGMTLYPGTGFYGASRGMSLQKPVAPTPRASGVYQNHWYGGWNR